MDAGAGAIGGTGVALAFTDVVEMVVEVADVVDEEETTLTAEAAMVGLDAVVEFARAAP